MSHEQDCRQMETKMTRILKIRGISETNNKESGLRKLNTHKEF